MLFDLRGRGRRNTIKVIYAFLAFLMGGSLVLLGFGSGGNGGLLDAITGNGSSSGDTGSKRYEKQETAALTRLKTDPKNVGAYESLIEARIQLAGLDDNYDVKDDTYTDKGRAELRQATQAWESLEKLNPSKNDELGDAANRVAGAYLELNQPEKLYDAQATFAEIRNATGPYQQLAQIAYQLGKTRLGDLAAQKAIELAPEDQRPTVKSDMDSLKQSAASSDTTQAVTPVPTAAASPTATTSGKSKTGGATAKPKATATAKPKATATAKPKPTAKPKAKSKDKK